MCHNWTTPDFKENKTINSVYTSSMRCSVYHMHQFGVLVLFDDGEISRDIRK